MDKYLWLSIAASAGTWVAFRLFGSPDHYLAALIVLCTGIILREIRKMRQCDDEQPEEKK